MDSTFKLRDSTMGFCVLIKKEGWRKQLQYHSESRTLVTKQSCILSTLCTFRNKTIQQKKNHTVDILLDLHAKS